MLIYLDIFENWMQAEWLLASVYCIESNINACSLHNVLMYGDVQLPLKVEHKIKIKKTRHCEKKFSYKRYIF